MKKKLEFECMFDGVPTNFKDNGKPYCIDCYVKIRNSAHTHLPVNPWPINPMPTKLGGGTFTASPMRTVIC